MTRDDIVWSATTSIVTDDNGWPFAALKVTGELGARNVTAQLDLNLLRVLSDGPHTGFWEEVAVGLTPFAEVLLAADQ